MQRSKSSLRCKAYLRLFVLLFAPVLLSFPGAVAAEDAAFQSYSTACNSRNFEQVTMLVNRGFNVNMRDGGGRTPLIHTAANAADELFAARVAGLLLARGADVNAEDSFGRSALVYSIEQDKQVLTEYLLKYGADVERETQAYGMPVVFVPFIHLNPAMARLVVQRLRNVNIRGAVGATPLSWACRYGYLDLTEQLLKAGANVNSKSRHSKTSLMEAAEKGHYEITKLLVRAGADVNVQTEKGWSALMWASEKGFVDIVSLLIEAGADLFMKNGKGERALVIARKNNNPETVKTIEAAESRVRLKRMVALGAPVLFLMVLAIVAAAWRIRMRLRSRGL